MADDVILSEISDHLVRIASANGYNDWRTLWEANTELKQKRKKPFVLFHGDKNPDVTHQDAGGHEKKGAAGDTVKVPDPQSTQESGGTDAHHPFQTSTDKVFLRLRVLDETLVAMKDATYNLYVDGIKYPADGDGQFEAGGMINQEVRKTAITGKLVVKYTPTKAQQEALTGPTTIEGQSAGGSSSGSSSSSTSDTTTSSQTATTASSPSSGQDETTPDPIEVVFHLRIGRLDPIQEDAPDEKCLSGAQQRLNNLGFGAGRVNGIDNSSTKAALRSYQRRMKITVTGDSDADTQKSLAEFHDQPGSASPTEQPEQSASTSGSSSTASSSGGTQAASSDSTSETEAAPTITITGREKTSARAAGVLEAVLKEASLTAATIISGSRTPAEQARAMYDAFASGDRNIRNHRKLYGPKGGEVIDIYVVRRRDAKDAVIGSMEDKIKSVGPENVSKHCGTTHDAIDVDPASLENRAAFAAAARANSDVEKLTTPEDNNEQAYHLEIPKGS